MTLKQAIEQAGKGGAECGIYSFKPCADLIEFFLDGKNIDYIPKAILTSENWEVVSPSIQVGDVVEISKYKGSSCGCEHEVLSIDNGRAHMEGIVELEPLSDLTFIRRPESHVFEGVEMRAISHNHKEISVYVEKGFDLDVGMMSKTYTMILKEKKNKDAPEHTDRINEVGL